MPGRGRPRHLGTRRPLAPARALAAAALLCAALLTTATAPGDAVATSGATSHRATAGSGPPEVVQREVVGAYSAPAADGTTRVDPWIVWVCALEPGGPVPERVSMTPADVVAALEAHVAPYFEWLSEGAYRPTFTPGGTIAAGTNDADDATCTSTAVAAAPSAGYAGAVVITDAPVQVAVGQSGHKACASPPCTASSVLPGNQRWLQLGAQDLFPTTRFGEPYYAETAHELGHTLDWGHAGPDAGYLTSQPGEPGFGGTVDPDAAWIDGMFSGWVAEFDAQMTSSGLPTLSAARSTLGGQAVTCDPFPATLAGTTICLLYSVLEYADITDVMGVTPPASTSDTRAIPTTQVFNRYAAGWLAPQHVSVHDGDGGARYVLAPIDVDGTRMLVLPSDDPRRFVTVEARGSSPFLPDDDRLPGADDRGVLVHVVDQRPDACGAPDCWGDVAWKTTVLDGEPWSFGQVLGAGDGITIDGVPLRVLDVASDGSATVAVGDPPPPTTSTTTPPIAVLAPTPPATAPPRFAG